MKPTTFFARLLLFPFVLASAFIGGIMAFFILGLERFFETASGEAEVRVTIKLILTCTFWIWPYNYFMKVLKAGNHRWYRPTGIDWDRE